MSRTRRADHGTSSIWTVRAPRRDTTDAVSQPMATADTPSAADGGIDLTDEQTTKLLRLLELVENAERREEAVFLDTESRETVSEIRRTIEEQT